MSLIKIDFEKKESTCTTCGEVIPFYELCLFECPSCKAFHHYCNNCSKTFFVALPEEKLYSEIEESFGNETGLNISDAHIDSLEIDKAV